MAEYRVTCEKLDYEQSDTQDFYPKVAVKQNCDNDLLQIAGRKFQTDLDPNRAASGLRGLPYPGRIRAYPAVSGRIRPYLGPNPERIRNVSGAIRVLADFL